MAREGDVEADAGFQDAIVEVVARVVQRRRVVALPLAKPQIGTRALLQHE